MNTEMIPSASIWANVGRYTKIFPVSMWIAVVAFTGCSSWQEQDPKYYSDRQTTRTPVAFRQEGGYQQDVRYRVQQRPQDNVPADYYANNRGTGGRNSYYYDGQRAAQPYTVREGWDNATGYRESSSARTQTADPMQRQWNNLRQGNSRPAPNWQTQNYLDRNYGYEGDEIVGLRHSTSNRISSDALREKSRPASAGFSVNYDALAPGSRLAEEQRRTLDAEALRRQEELRLAEERRNNRTTGRTQEVSATRTVVGDLPRPLEFDRSGRTIPLNEIVRSEIKPDVVPVSTTASQRLAPGSSVYSRANRLSLAQLMGQKGPLMLRGPSPRTQIPVKISPRLKVDEWNLRLHYTHSSSVIPGQSQITIAVNQVVVAQVDMVPDQPYNTVEIPLPRDLARGRNHQIQISVSQPLPANALDAERFTQINLEQSYVEVKGHMTPVTTRLSELQRLFDYQMIGQQYPIHLCIPGSSVVNETMLGWGGTVSQGVGLRVDQMPLKLSHGERLRNNQDNILIGKIADIDPFLEGNLSSQVHGPFIGIQPLYHDDRHFIIILTGRNEEEVYKAVQAFAITPEVLPESAYFHVNDVRLNMKAGTIPIGSIPVTVPGTYSFGNLGSFSRGLNQADQEYVVNITLPGDYQASREKDAVLEVHFTSPGQDADRLFLHVMVGDLFVGSISVAEGGDGSYRKRTVSLPPQALRSGNNQIRLVYRVDSSGNRSGREVPPVAILESSMIILPASSGSRELPDLGLLSRSGFPLTDIREPGDLTVYITDGNPLSVDSAWTFMSKIAQVSGSYLLGVNLTFVQPEAPRNLVVIGLWEQLSDEWHAGAPLFSGRGVLEYQISRRNPYDTEKRTYSFSERLQRTFDGSSAKTPEFTHEQRLSIGVGGDIPRTVMVSQYENPVRRGYLVTMIAAGSPNSLYDGVLKLQEPVIWNSMHGEMMMLSQIDGAPSFEKGQNRFAYRGEFEFKKAAVNIIWGDTWVQVLVILGALLLLALGTALWIRKTTSGYEFATPSSSREEEL